MRKHFYWLQNLVVLNFRPSLSQGTDSPQSNHLLTLSVPSLLGNLSLRFPGNDRMDEVNK